MDELGKFIADFLKDNGTLGIGTYLALNGLWWFLYNIWPGKKYEPSREYKRLISFFAPFMLVAIIFGLGAALGYLAVTPNALFLAGKVAAFEAIGKQGIFTATELIGTKTGATNNKVTDDSILDAVQFGEEVASGNIGPLQEKYQAYYRAETEAGRPPMRYSAWLQARRRGEL